MVCAAFLLMKHVSELTHVELETNSNGRSARPLPPGCLVYKIRGSIFFGSVEKAFDRYLFTHDYTTRFILDITDVPFIDLTGLVALKARLVSIAGEHRKVSIICADAGI
jgi:sulfate permease, SulP family